MTQWAKKLEENLASPFATKVFYFASTEESLLKIAAEKVKTTLMQSAQCDYICFEKDFEIAQLAQAAATISFLGGWRLAEIKDLSPAALSEKDIKEIAKLFLNLNGTVVIIGTVFADKKAETGKRAQAVFAAAQKAGFAALLAKPTQRETVEYIVSCAKAAGASISSDAAQTLLQRVGEGWPSLKNETMKLAAVVNYSTITKQDVQKHAAASIEADVFDLARCITSRRAALAFEKTAALFAQKVEPTVVAAALASSFVDMYRVHCGAKQGLATGQIFKEMGYFGSEYRLQKAKEAAMQYSGTQLQQCVLCLATLDKQLKSSLVQDKTILLEAAVATLLQIGARAWAN